MRRAIVLPFCALACTPVCPRGDCPSDASVIDLGDGWDDRFGRGRIYVISSLAAAEEGVGFDLDGRCAGEVCTDNRLRGLWQLLDAQIQSQHFQGFGRTLIELAGAETLTEDDPRATLKTYDAIDIPDSNGNPFPTDDFTQCFGCARFYVNEDSLVGDNARYRAPAKIEKGVFRNAGDGTIAFTLPLAQQTRVMPLERAAFEIKLTSPQTTDPSLEMLLAGGVRASELAKILVAECLRSNPGPEPPCRTTLLDYLASRGVQPDIDLDDDGLETFAFDPDTGRIGGCFDGCIEACPHDLPIAPEDVDEPASCAFAGSVRDAYSLTLISKATPAFIQGVR